MASSVIPRAEYAALEHGIYLNQASLGLIPRRSLQVMVEFLTEIAQHGNIRLSDEAEAHVLDELRAIGAQLFDAPVRAMAVVGGASEALGQLAALSAEPGGEVVLVASDFPSVTYPWLAAQARLGMAIRWVDDVPDRTLTAGLIDAIRETTTVVCFGAVQFATGSLVDVAAVVGRARAVGARVIVDITQMAGALPVSMRAWNADALVCSGYKWLSAHGGVALLAIGDEFINRIPALVGWKGAENPFALAPTTLALATDARRFELSTIAYSSAAGLTTSAKLLSDVGIDVLDRNARLLSRELVDAVAPLGWTPFRDPDDAGATDHIVSLRHGTLAAPAVRERLAENHHVNVSARLGRIRVSLHGYNDSDDVAGLVAALETTAASLA
jgi:selenocysteine lyase/cysteine desulfurase